MVYMDEESFSQQELFQQEKYISDLVDEKTGDYRSGTTSANIKKLVALRRSQLSEG